MEGWLLNPQTIGKNKGLTGFNHGVNRVVGANPLRSLGENKDE